MIKMIKEWLFKRKMKERKKITKKEFDAMSVEERGKLLIRDYLMLMLRVVLRGKPNINIWEYVSCPKCLHEHTIRFIAPEELWLPCQKCGYEFPDSIIPPNEFELRDALKSMKLLKKFLSHKELYQALILETE